MLLSFNFDCSISSAPIAWISWGSFIYGQKNTMQTWLVESVLQTGVSNQLGLLQAEILLSLILSLRKYLIQDDAKGDCGVTHESKPFHFLFSYHIIIRRRLFEGEGKAQHNSNQVIVPVIRVFRVFLVIRVFRVFLVIRVI